ncbi:hypothetical protein GCM10017600_09780 [Streptosporangium carneum]|uniref:Uncharacterized protein n=1 Tax=Streptosporangium carneum TaxID=47481 RepID=A0A9W6MBD7_9ACTN|nr:hypothetical protein GCM10017600_09780 [Streptosporangium carneum]
MLRVRSLRREERRMGDHAGKPAEDKRLIPGAPKGPELDGGAPPGQHEKPKPDPKK